MEPTHPLVQVLKNMDKVSGIPAVPGLTAPDQTHHSLPPIKPPAGESAPEAILTREELQDIVHIMEFSPRQVEVLNLLLGAHSDKEIAEKMQVGLATVRTHLRRMFIRHRVSDRTELVIAVFREFRKNCRQKGCPRLDYSLKNTA